jgi:uncharacterized membrane protein
MLSDIITLVLGFALVLFGIQSMLDVQVRKNSSEVVKSVTLVIGGLFLIYYWNKMTSLSSN